MRWLVVLLLAGGLMAGCSNSEEAPEADVTPAEPPTKAEQLAKLKALQDKAEKLKAGPEPPPREPNLARREGETDQQLYLRIQQALRQARRLTLNEDYEDAHYFYTQSLAALEALPEGFNQEIVELRLAKGKKELELVTAKLGAVNTLVGGGWTYADSDRYRDSFFLARKAVKLKESGETAASIKAHREAITQLQGELKRMREVFGDGPAIVSNSPGFRAQEILRKLQENLIALLAQQKSEQEAIPGLISGMPAPMEGEQALFLKTVRQVQNARKYEEQGRLRPALAEYEAALKNMKKMAPELKHGDGGPDDDVRDAIRRLKRKVKK